MVYREIVDYYPINYCDTVICIDRTCRRIVISLDDDESFITVGINELESFPDEFTISFRKYDDENGKKLTLKCNDYMIKDGTELKIPMSVLIDSDESYPGHAIISLIFMSVSMPGVRTKSCDHKPVHVEYNFYILGLESDFDQ